MRSILLAACVVAASLPLYAQTTTIDHVTIVDVTNGRLQERRTIVIEGNGIARIENATAATRARSRRRLEMIRRLHAAKIPFLAGTDAPAGYDLVPGASLHRELELFVRAGMTPLQALQTATLNPAVYFGKSAEWGTVTAGKVADLVVLARNPLSDIANTRSVVAVATDGRFFSPRELEAMRLRIMELAAK